MDEREYYAEEASDSRTDEYIVRKRALFRKIVNACEGSGLTTAGVVSVLREVVDQINVCRNSRPMDDIIGEMRKSRFYQTDERF